MSVRKIIPQSDGRGGHPIVELVGLSLQTLWRKERAGTFPKRLQTSDGRVGWFYDEVLDYLESRPRGPLPAPHRDAA